MKLHEDQLNLIRHAIRFPVTDYLDCLEILGGTEGGDRVKLSYAFRPLTKNGYLAKRKDGSVSVLAKGRALFPEERPLISAGCGDADMLLICWEDSRDKVAENIIRQTMWHRRQLLSTKYAERNKPARWSRSPIRLRTQYERVYLTTPGRLNKSLQTIWAEGSYIEEFLEDGTRINDPVQGDIERWPYRYFVNPACDLLKYIYFFSAAKELLKLLENPSLHTPLRYAICYDEGDVGILRLYPDVIEMEGMQFYEYRSEEDTGAD